jgi:mannosyltransferase
MQNFNIARIIPVELSSRHQNLLLAGITVLALALRLYKLGEWSFSDDEMTTVIAARYISDWPLARLPIYLVLIRAAFELFGTSEWSARLAPVLVGVLTIPAIFSPVRKMFGNTTALITALLLSFSLWHIYWSQNARYYTLILLFYSLSIFFFYLGLDQKRTWYLFLSMVFMVLAARERLFTLYLVPVFVGYLLLAPMLSGERSSKLQPRALLSLFFPTILLLLIFSWSRVLGLMEHFNSYNGFEVNNPSWILSGIFYYLGIPLICAGIFGMFFLLLKKSREGLLISLGAVIPVVSTLFLANFVYTGNRYAFVSLICWIILASVGIKELFRYASGSMRWLVVLPLAMILLSYISEDILYFQYQHGNRANWKAAFELVQERKQAGDMVASVNPRVADFYLGEQTLDIRNIDLDDLEQSGSKVWIIEEILVADYFPETHQWILEHSKLVADFSHEVEARKFHMKVFLFTPASSNSSIVY